MDHQDARSDAHAKTPGKLTGYPALFVQKYGNQAVKKKIQGYDKSQNIDTDRIQITAGRNLAAGPGLNNKAHVPAHKIHA